MGEKVKASDVVTINLSTTIIPVQPWQSREEALDYLRGDFHTWHILVGDMLDRGLRVDPHVMGDLAEIGSAAAEYVSSPGPVEVDHSAASEFLPEIARMLRDAEEAKLGTAWLFDALTAAVEECELDREAERALAAAADLEAEARAGAEAGA